MKCRDHNNPEQGPCFPPNMLGDAEYILVDADPESPVPNVPICTGHLQRLMTIIMHRMCQQADIELLFDDHGLAFIDPEVSQAWEKESREYEGR